EVAAEAESRMAVLELGVLGEVADRGAAVTPVAKLRVDVVLSELRLREVAEALIDPVGHQPADDPPLVPVGLALLVEPGLRGLPLVVDLVVVEDHRRRQGREHPADYRVGPDVAVADRVLLEVLEGVDRAVAVDLAWSNLLADVLRRLVGVELVAEHHHRVRPVRFRLAPQPQRERVERLESPPLSMPPALEGVRGPVRRRGPA